MLTGSNWLDGMFNRKDDYINAKAFVSLEKSYSIVGFRYVIHVLPKTE